MCGLKNCKNLAFLGLLGLDLKINYAAFGIKPLNLAHNRDHRMRLANELSQQPAAICPQLACSERIPCLKLS